MQAPASGFDPFAKAPQQEEQALAFGFDPFAEADSGNTDAVIGREERGPGKPEAVKEKVELQITVDTFLAGFVLFSSVQSGQMIELERQGCLCTLAAAGGLWLFCERYLLLCNVHAS